MPNPTCLPSVLLSGLLLAQTASAELLLGDAAKGKALHAAQCTVCHDSTHYTRANRRVKSIEGLMGQVEVCNKQLKKGYTDEQINDLVYYLNETYYKFE